MLKIEEHTSLLSYNTFGIDIKSRYLVKVKTQEELIAVLKQFQNLPLRIIGSGSNVLFTKDFEGLTVVMGTTGISISSENKNQTLVEIQAGEVWHDVVLWALKNNLGGIENLALIPGCMGAAPIQNIGAYGVELESVFHSCKTLDIENLTVHEYKKEQCQFGYRSSIFKTQLKGKQMITSVKLILQKPPHQLTLSYGALKEEMKQKSQTIQSVAETVIAIRESKLPDPKRIGNSGSFFKNPVVSVSHFNSILKKHPNAPHFPFNAAFVKIPAAWLIETSGFKGYRDGDAGVHDKQALVLVNHGNAKGTELLQLSQKIQSKVENLFNIRLEPEVNIL